MEESRVKKSLLNARVNLIFYVLILLISFFSRKIFLNCLGADFVGLTGTLMSLLNFLNLAELGISTAIGYVLYKPIFEHDETRINEIISVLGYMYRWIGRIIIAAGVALSFHGLFLWDHLFCLLFLSGLFPDRVFRQLQADPFGSGPEELRSGVLFPDGIHHQNHMPDAVCMVYGKLLFMDRDRTVLRHYLFLHPELEDQSGISLAEERCGPGKGAVQKIS